MTSSITVKITLNDAGSVTQVTANKQVIEGQQSEDGDKVIYLLGGDIGQEICLIQNIV